MEIRAYTVEQVTQDITPLSSLKDPENLLPEARDNWVRMLNENPSVKPTDLAMIVAVDGNKVVGRLGFWAASAVVDGKPLRTYWTAGFFLDPQYIHTGAGAMILLRGVSACKSVLVCGGPSESLQKLYQAAGFVKLGALKRFLYFYSPRVLAHRVARPRWLAPVAAAVIWPILKSYYFVRRRLRRPRLEYRPVKQFDARIDELLSRGPINRLFRDSATLNWAMRFRSIEAFEIYDRGNLVGYCLLKQVRVNAGGPHDLPDMRMGSLLDYHLARPGKADKLDLALFALSSFAAQGVDVGELQLFDPEFESVCRGLGMVHLGGNKVFFRPPPGAKVDPTAGWSFTLATGDMILMGE